MTATESASVTSLLSADRPITSHSEDRLRRSRFANELAKVIRQWRGRDSLVIAIFGPWGSGKTSVKNLVIESLTPGAPVEILEFNPWQWSGHEQISDAFFNEIAKKLGRKGTSERAQKAAKYVKAYSAFLG